MKKKIILIISIVISLLVTVVIYQALSLNDTKQIIHDSNTKGKTQIVHDSIKNYEITTCNLNIFKPEIAYVSYSKRVDSGRERYHVSFYNFQKENIIFGKWNFEYTGGTTVKNTTFNNLLKMVKEDCYQFQKSGSIGIKQDSIQWIYSKVESKEREEQRRKRKEEREKKEREEWNKLSEKEKQKILEENKKVDEFMNLSDEEKLKIIEEKFSD